MVLRPAPVLAGARRGSGSGDAVEDVCNGWSFTTGFRFEVILDTLAVRASLGVLNRLCPFCGVTLHTPLLYVFLKIAEGDLSRGVLGAM